MSYNYFFQDALLEEEESNLVEEEEAEVEEDGALEE